MQLAILTASTAIIFLALDAIMITTVMRPLFAAHLGESLLPGLRLAPAVLFYLIYVAGMIYLVSYPALKTATPVLIPAVVLGLMAYGTDELTSYSVMKAWHPAMVLADMAWGALLTGFAAWAGVQITRAFAP